MKYQAIDNTITGIEKLSKIFLRKIFKEYGLNLAEGLVLLSFFYGDQEYYTQDSLVEKLRCDKGVMARTMQSLERQYYLLRADNPKDKRSFIFNLAERGLEFKKTIQPSMTKWHELITKGITAEELDKVQSILDKILRNLLSSKKD